KAYADYRGVLPGPFPRVVGPNSLKYLQEVIDAGLGSDLTERFERKFAEAMDVKHCISAPGCTNALMILGEALPFEPGDEVIVSSITDYGSIMGIVKRGFIPIFADTARNSINITADTIAPLITNRTRAVLCVHKTGIVCDMDPILDLAAKHGLLVIEDVCQAVYSRYKGRLAGTIGHVGAFSFDTEKTMGSDLGGCLITNDDALAARAKLRGHSRGGEMKAGFGRVHTWPGQALRMPQCTAAICLAQLEIIEEQVRHIDRIVRRLYAGLSEIPGLHPPEIPAYLDQFSCWMAGFSIDPDLFSISAAEFADACAERGLTGAGVAPYYLMPEACVFLQRQAEQRQYPYSAPQASREYSYSAAQCPNARAFLSTFVRWSTICAKWQDEHVDTCVEIVKEVAARHQR
ncbi:MAG TPA: DegT/DnrJ/EryC1/StrS family aminotransferase, partial [Planctomycetota bacterium]|nr:DegT/DnrJ/EryC1/StrS family aminotransferase [Planctomycetota bacterium]